MKKKPSSGCAPDGMILRSTSDGTEVRRKLGKFEDWDVTGVFEISWFEDQKQLAFVFGSESGSSSPAVTASDSGIDLSDSVQFIKSPVSNEDWVHPQLVPQGLIVIALCCDQGIPGDPTLRQPTRLVLTDMNGSRTILMEFSDYVAHYDFEGQGSYLVWVSPEGTLRRAKSDGSESVVLGEGIQTAYW